MNQRTLQTDAAIVKSSDYRKLMKEIDDHLMKRDVESLKFLCCDVLAVSKQEKISRGIELINELEHKGRVNEGNLLFFAELLYHIGRYDLLTKVGYSQTVMKSLIDSQGSQLSPYRIALHKVSEELTTSDVDTMKFICNRDFSRMRLEQIKSPMDLFLGLEHTQKLGPSNLDLLREMLEAVDKESVLQYMKTVGSGCKDPGRPHKKASKTLDSLDESSFDLNLSLKFEKTSGSNNISKTNSGKKIDVPSASLPCNAPPPREQRQARQETPAFLPQYPQIYYGMPNQPQGQMYVGGPMFPQHQGHVPFVPPNMGYFVPVLPENQNINVSRSSGGQTQRQQRTSNDSVFPSYKMDSKPRGNCIIINNHHFKHDANDSNSRKMPDRDGTDVDCGNLEYIFKKLDFIVHVYTDLTTEQITNRLANFAVNQDHKKFDCFICCILSHGMEGKIYGTDGKTVEIKDLLNFYKGSTASSLCGKPKLFFIQACQGKAKQKAVPLEKDGPLSGDAVVNDSPVSMETIPNEADFLLGYAALPGYVSFRSRREGTWYISTLVKILDKFHKSADLLSMLIKVNEEVGRATAFSEFKQCPAPLATLRKKIYFR